MFDLLIPLASITAIAVVLIVVLPAVIVGLVIINERQVGIVVKRFAAGKKSLPDGQLVALKSEPGYQADTLAPGWHFGYWSWMYNVQKVPVTVIPQGEIGLVVAADGSPIPAERILGKVVDFYTEIGDKRNCAFINHRQQSICAGEGDIGHSRVVLVVGNAIAHFGNYSP